MNWATGSYHLIEAKAAVAGLIGRAGGPCSLLDVEARIFFAFTEGILRDSEPHQKALDKLYDEHAAKARSKVVGRSDRNREIAKLSRLFGA
jgi:hypothetical protein